MREDIADLTCSEVISEELGVKLQNVKPEQLGGAECVTAKPCLRRNATRLWGLDRAGAPSEGAAAMNINGFGE